MGSAWATLICYATMMVLSYIIGQRYYYVKYDVPRILGYMALGLLLFFIGKYIALPSKMFTLLVNNLMLLLFIVVIIIVEKPQRFLKQKKVQAPGEQV